MPIVYNKPNKHYKIQDVFPYLTVGMRIICDGDDWQASTTNYIGEITKKGEDFIEVRREDGREGGGDNNTWNVVNDPDSTARVIIYDATRYETVRYEDIHFMDVISVEMASGDQHLAIVLQKIGHGKLLVRQLVGGNESQTIEVGTEAKLYFKLRYLVCDMSGCVENASVAVGNSVYCSTHVAERGGVQACQLCGINVFISDLYALQSDGDVISTCSTCYREHEEESRIIHDHSYKPRAKFITVNPTDTSLASKLFEGVENEVECPHLSTAASNSLSLSRVNRLSEKEKLVAQIIKKFNKNKWFYVKRDGSLINGFELVTHPATLDAHRTQIPWKELCQFYAENGIVSDTTDTCGLHIHASKNILNKEHQIRLGLFASMQKRKLEVIARRSQCHWAQFKRPDTPLERMNVNESGSKYEALNWDPPATVEFRLFKGTIEHTNMIVALEFVHAAILFTETATIELLKARRKCWLAFVKFCVEKRYVTLVDYLIKHTTTGMNGPLEEE